MKNVKKMTGIYIRVLIDRHSYSVSLRIKYSNTLIKNRDYMQNVDSYIKCRCTHEMQVYTQNSRKGIYYIHPFLLSNAINYYKTFFATIKIVENICLSRAKISRCGIGVNDRLHPGVFILADKLCEAIMHKLPTYFQIGCGGCEEYEEGPKWVQSSLSDGIELV